MIKYTIIAKCVLCCKVNSQRKKSLPCICPRSDTLCLAINPKWVDEANLLDLFNGLEKEEGNKKISEFEEPRVPLKSKYIDQYFLEQMLKVYQ